VFQFESRGMRDLLKQAPPTRFEDVIALVALYRPGPMELIPDYVARKSGRERVEYVDPRLAPILEPTYGVMVYQEQVMQIAQEIGGYTLGLTSIRLATGNGKAACCRQMRCAASRRAIGSWRLPFRRCSARHRCQRRQGIHWCGGAPLAKSFGIVFASTSQRFCRFSF